MSEQTQSGRAASTSDGEDGRGSMLGHLLLVAVLFELLVHRLAVPGLQPVRTTPPGWHTALAWVGNFAFYFAFAFAVALILRELARGLFRSAEHGRIVAVGLVFSGGLLTVQMAIAVFSIPSETLLFLLNATFTAALFIVVASQIRPGGDLGARIGVVLLALPLILHFYAPFALRFGSGQDLGLPERVQIFGQWGLVFSALATPYCFAPRPFAGSAARISPFIVAIFVTLLGAVVTRRAGEVGMDLARDGFGLALDPLAPTSMLSLYIMALAAVAWTLVSTLSARSPARRMIGLGIAMVVLGGYGFEWPLQYALGFLGLVLISAAARRVRSEEARVGLEGNHQVLTTAEWERSISALTTAIETRTGSQVSKLTLSDSPNQRTHLVWKQAGVSRKLTFVRERGRVRSVDILVGNEPADGIAPALTVWTKPKGGRRPHPVPPAAVGSAMRLGDAEFDERLQLRAETELAERVFGNETVVAKTAATLEGWLAVWPDIGIRQHIASAFANRETVATDVIRLATDDAARARFAEWLDFLDSLAERALVLDQAHENGVPS